LPTTGTLNDFVTRPKGYKLNTVNYIDVYIVFDSVNTASQV